MMTLYSGTTDPFSQRCRIVLHEKGMDFQIIDVDLDHKPEDLAVMNPYNQVPVLVERDLVLHDGYDGHFAASFRTVVTLRNVAGTPSAFSSVEFEILSTIIRSRAYQ